MAGRNQKQEKIEAEQRAGDRVPGQKTEYRKQGPADEGWAKKKGNVGVQDLTAQNADVKRGGRK